MRRFAAWIASIAVLLSALMPAVASAFAVPALDALISAEICSTQNIPAVDDASDVPGQPSGPAQALHFDHCPYCHIHGGSFGLLPAEADAVIPLQDAPAYPPRFYRSPRPLFVWAAPPSRGPPVHS